MPTYESHPLPGMPGGGPPLAAFGWGPGPGGDKKHALGDRKPPRRVRPALFVSMLVTCSVVIACLGLSAILLR